MKVDWAIHCSLSRSVDLRFFLISSVVDTDDLDRFEDPSEADLSKNFIIPEGLKVAREVFRVEPGQIIAPFVPFKSDCIDRDQDDQPTLSVQSDYNVTGVEADFVLYVDVVNRPQKLFLSYAKYCVLGTEIWLRLFRGQMLKMKLPGSCWPVVFYSTSIA